MATFSKLVLSGSTDGKLIKVVPTATAGTTIHTGSATATTFDEVWLYAQTNHTADVLLTVEFGGVASPDDLIQVTVPFNEGLFLVVAGLPIQGNATPLVIKAFAATANVISIGGYVNRITA
jgi:hypothetical protein